MIDIVFLKNENKAVAYENEKVIGECDFIELENIWNIVHTKVDAQYQGCGIARRLVECVIENTKKYRKDLIAECSYAQKVIEQYKK